MTCIVPGCPRHPEHDDGQQVRAEVPLLAARRAGAGGRGGRGRGGERAGHRAAAAAHGGGAVHVQDQGLVDLRGLPPPQCQVRVRLKL